MAIAKNSPQRMGSVVAAKIIVMISRLPPTKISTRPYSMMMMMMMISKTMTQLRKAQLPISTQMVSVKHQQHIRMPILSLALLFMRPKFRRNRESQRLDPI